MVHVKDSISSTFSRTAANIKKMGAYYTDRAHCMDISKMFMFPKEEPVTVLEPSIGDGFAVTSVTNAAENGNIHIFGVELNEAVAEETRKNPLIEDVLTGDFLSDVKISNKVFSFVFGNPPYISEQEEELRLAEIESRTEWKFLEKVTNFMMTGGILVWIIPYRIFTNSVYFGRFVNRFDLLRIYKFRKTEFEKFRQVVVVGRRLAGIKSIGREKKTKMLEGIQLDSLKELPEEFKPDEIIMVPPSDPKALKMFCLKKFDVEEAVRILDSTALQDVRALIGKELKQEKFQEMNMGRPIIPLKKDSLYLCASAGAGIGMVGSEGDLHLQRGHVKMVETTEFQRDPKNKKKMVAVTVTRPQVNMTIVENDGMISHLL